MNLVSMNCKFYGACNSALGLSKSFSRCGDTFPDSTTLGCNKATFGRKSHFCTSSLISTGKVYGKLSPCTYCWRLKVLCSQHKFVVNNTALYGFSLKMPGRGFLEGTHFFQPTAINRVHCMARQETVTSLSSPLWIATTTAENVFLTMVYRRHFAIESDVRITWNSCCATIILCRTCVSDSIELKLSNFQRKHLKMIPRKFQLILRSLHRAASTSVKMYPKYAGLFFTEQGMFTHFWIWNVCKSE